MSGFRVLPLGVGDAFSAVYYSSCLALEAEGCWLLIDCPHPVRKMMREAATAVGVELDLDRILAVALTHMHADHSSGLEDAAYYCRYVLSRRLQLFAHPDTSEHLWEGSLFAGMGWQPADSPEPAKQLADFIDLQPLSESGEVQVGPFALRCRRTLHPIPTFALRVRAAGRTLGCSADTAYDPTLIDWLSAADLVIHETNVSIHTPYEKLAVLPAELRRKMRLIHYPDDFDHAASVIEPLHQGRWYPV